MMSETLAWLIVAVLAVGLLGSYLAWTAGRVDRMHGRVEAARASLSAALQRRSGVALEIATAGLLDPATAVLVVDSAHRAREAPPQAEEQAESDLSRALAAAFPLPLSDAGDPTPDRPAQQMVEPSDPTPASTMDEGGPGERPERTAEPSLFTELAEASKRVELARRFHNDAVRATHALRRHRLVRWLHLAGHAPLPEPVDFDDSSPPGLHD